MALGAKDEREENEAKDDDNNDQGTHIQFLNTTSNHQSEGKVLVGSQPN